MTISLLGRRRWAVAGLLAYAGAASLTTPLAVVVSAAVLVPAVVVLVLAGAQRTGADTRLVEERLSWTALAWGGLVLLTALWDLAAWLAQPAYNVASAAHPTISLLLDPLSGSPLPRFVLWSCWLYIGYRLVRR